MAVHAAMHGPGRRLRLQHTSLDSATPLQLQWRRHSDSHRSSKLLGAISSVHKPAYVRVPGYTSKASGIGAHLENMHYCVGSWESLEPDGFYGDEAISTVGSSTQGDDKARVAALQNSAGHHAAPVAVLTCYNTKIISGPGCPDSAHLTPVHEHRQRYRDWSSLHAVGVDEATLPPQSSDGGAVPDLQIRYPPRISAASFAKVTEPHTMPPASDNRKLADIASRRSRTDFNSVDSESVFTMDDPVVFSGTAVSVTG
eukprot:COSAG01_NODE_13962_length_1513_cov_116.601132_1_plen_255_part_10